MRWRWQRRRCDIGSAGPVACAIARAIACAIPSHASAAAPTACGTAAAACAAPKRGVVADPFHRARRRRGI